jgi:Icc-related predicted phosphoesterase
MQRFLIISGINGRDEALLQLQTIVRDRRPDGLLFAGGVLPPDREDLTDFDTECYTKEGTLFVERFFSTLGSLGVFSAVIPGVFDAPLDEFLGLGMAAEREYPKIHLVHVTPVEEGDIGIFGLGGCITDHTSTGVGYYSRTLAKYYLRPICTAKPPRKVVLLSDLQDWQGDSANEQHVADALTATYHPMVCVLGSPGAKGHIERIAETLLIRPGHFADGSAAWLDLGRTGDDQAELLDLRQPATQRETNPGAPIDLVTVEA